MQQFKNAQIGVDKLFKAEIILIISEILAAFGLVFTVLATASRGAGGILIGATVAVVLVLAAAVFAIIAVVQNISGLNIAKKDDVGYQNAFTAVICVLVGEIAQAICSCISGVPTWLTSLLDVFVFISQLFLFWFVIKTTEKLLVMRGRPLIAQKGNTIFVLIISGFILAIIARVFSAIFSHLVVVAIITAMLSLIALLVAYITYLMFLNQARKSLAD